MSEFVAQIRAELETSEAEAKLKSLTKEREVKLKTNIDVDKSSTKSIDDAIKNTKKQVKPLEVQVDYKTNKKSISQLSDLTNTASKLFSMFSGRNILDFGADKITESLKELKEMDTILTEISKTSDSTAAELKQLSNESYSAASEFGKKVTDYLTAVQEMSRSGFYGKQGEAMAELSLLGQAAGDMTADVSNSYLLATNAAYNYAGSVEKLNAVLDGQNMITNRNSVNMTDMANATSKAASMAAQTGVEVNELSAIISTAVSRTKQNGNVIGTALKSLFVNLQDTSNEKIVDTFKELDISQTKYVNGAEQLKTPIELLKELSVAYSNLPEGSTLKSDVLRNIGQKRQANVLAAILGGMSSGDYEKMLKDYSESAGSAAIEAEKSAQSLEGRLNKLSNSWTEFVNNFAQADTMKSGVSFLDGIVSSMDALQDKQLFLPTMLSSIMGLQNLFTGKGITDVGLSKDGTGSLGKLDVKGKLFGIDFTEIGSWKKHFSECSSLLSEWNDLCLKGKNDLDSFQTGLSKNDDGFRKYISTVKDGSASLDGYKKHLKDTGAEFEKFNMKSVLTNVATGFLVGAGIELGLAALTKVIDDVVQRKQRLIESATESTSAWKESSAALNEQITKYKTLKQQLDSGSLTPTAEYETRKQILDIQTQITDQYGKQASGIDLVNGSLQTQVGLLQQISAKEAKRTLNDNKEEYQDAYDEMTKERKYKLGSFSLDMPGKEDLNKEIEGIVKSFEDAGITPKWDGNNYGSYFDIIFTGDATQADKTVDEFMDKIQTLKSKYTDEGSIGIIDSILDQSAATLSKNDEKVLKKYQENYKSFLQMEMTSLGTEEGSVSDIFNDYIESVEKYNEALASGDTNAIANARSEFAALGAEVDDVLAKGDNSKFAILFEEVSDQLSEASIKAHDFQEALVGTKSDYNQFKDLSSDLKEAGESLKELELDAEGVRNALITAGEQTGESYIQTLAKAWGVDAESSTEEIYAFTDALIQAGLISGQVAGEIENSAESFDTFQTNILSAIEALDAVNASIASSFSGKGLSVEIDKETGELTGDLARIKAAYQDLDGYDASVLFEKTANGIHLNREALRALQAEQESTQKKANLDKIVSLQNQLSAELKKQKDLEAGTDAYKSSQLIISDLKNQLELARELSAVYEGATSAYQKWVNAQAGGKEGDMFRTVSETMRERGEQLYNEGRYNTNEFRAIADYFSNQDLSTASVEELVRAYEAAKPTIDSFFTGGKEGLDNFAAAMKQLSDSENLGWVEELEDGKIKFNTGSDEEIAERLGISKEAVQSLYRAMSEYFDDFIIGDTSNTEELNKKIAECAQKAEEAKARLKELQSEGEISTDIKLDVDVSELDEAGIEERIKSLESLKDDVELKFGADSSEVEYVNSLLDEANLRKEQLAQQVTTEVNLEINGESDLDTLGQKLSSLPKDETSNIFIDITNEEQLDGVVEQISQIPKDTPAKVSLSVNNKEQADELKAKLDELSAESGRNIEYTISVKDNSGDALSKKTSDDTKTVTVNEVQGTKIEIKDEEKTVTVNEVQGTKLLKSSPVDIKTVQYSKESSEVDAYTPEDKEATVKFDKDSSIPDNYKPSDKTATVVYSADTSGLPSSFDPITRIVQYEKRGDTGEGTSAYGTLSAPAHANGTAYNVMNSTPAYSNGQVALPKDERALINELGPEGLIRNGKLSWIPGGMHFQNFKKGDIILSAAQMKSLFQTGKASGTGHAYANGTMNARQLAATDLSAYSRGTWTFGDTGRGNLSGSGYFPSYPAYPAQSVSSAQSIAKSTSDAADSAKEFDETLDWIETKIDRIERQIKNLERTAGSAYNTFEKRNSALRDQMGSITEEISIQQAGYQRYLQEANSVPLDENYKSLVRSGAIDISTITDEELSKNIKKFQEWYEKALDCRDSIEELKESVRDLYAEAFDNVITLYDGILGQIEHRQNILEGYIDQTETQGYIVSTKYYDALISNEQTKLTKLTKQRQDLINAMHDAMVNGDIEMYSEEWYDMQQDINDVNEAIQDANTSIIEFNNSIREIKWDIFDKMQDRISAITDESNFLIDLMSNDDLYDDKGKVTKQGTATYGLHGVNYNVYMSQADQYKKEMRSIQDELAKDPYNEKLIERRKELLELQQESILAAEDEKEAIRDLVEDGINKQLDALDKLIDKYLDAIDSQKDMYDYQKKIDEKQNKVNALEKQLLATAGDDSEEGKANRQKLQTDLEEAKEDLEETQYDRAISDQKKLLDELYSEYERILNMRLDNIDQLIADVIANVNLESSEIRDTLVSESKNVGYELTNSMNTIWNNMSAALGSGGTIAGILTTYSDNFSSVMTTVQTAINDIKVLIQSAVHKSDKDATKNINNLNKTQADQTAKPAGIPNKPSTTPVKVSNGNGGDGVPRIGDAVTFASGRYFYSSDGLNPSGNQMLGQTVYITNINNASWAKKPYHISRTSRLGEQDLGWVSLDQLKGYKTGIKSVPKEELALWNEDEPETVVGKNGEILRLFKPGDSVLNNKAHNNIWDMANDPSTFIRSYLTPNLSNTPVTTMERNNTVQNEVTVNIGIDKVMDYNDFVKQAQSDPKFEKLVQAISIDRIAGKSSLNKYNVRI